MRLVIISGRSGSGKSSALNVLEDLGFYCIDNLPVGLLPALVKETDEQQRLAKVAVSVDARNLSHAFDQITTVLHDLPHDEYKLDVVFLDATNDIILQRFSATRRKHPLSKADVSLAEAIEKEGELLEPIKDMADLVVDTSGMSVHELRSLIRLRVADKQQGDIALLFESFGFKNGIPSDADYVFDVRNLPNPYWYPELRAFTGQDAEIQQFLSEQDAVSRMLNDIEQFLQNWLQDFVDANRSYMTIAIGCTGGQHRSVYCSEQLAQRFHQRFDQVQIRHRELRKVNQL